MHSYGFLAGIWADFVITNDIAAAAKDVVGGINYAKGYRERRNATVRPAVPIE